ncbi:Lrp/AsnC family transcriptional regulator [Saccharomonospora piscinae]|nr:Lrp/AsnC family transcriptional regulator [Saccharomonospora piscinae]
MAGVEMDGVDRRILEELQRDGRLPNTALADRVRLSPSPCLRRVRGLESSGVISGYRAEVDRFAVGLGLTVFVEIKVAGHSRDLAGRIEQTVARIPEVVGCHLVSGSADFLLEVVVANLQAYERLLLDTLLTLPGVEDLRSNFSLRTVKQASPLPLDHLRG